MFYKLLFEFDSLLLSFSPENSTLLTASTSVFWKTVFSLILHYLLGLNGLGRKWMIFRSLPLYGTFL